MISDEAVEAAANAMSVEQIDHRLDELNDHMRNKYVAEARAALEAALPHLLASQGCGTGHSGEQLEPAVGATAALAPVPCGGCGATENSKRCMGCLHDFGTPDSAWVHRYAASAEPKTEYVAVTEAVRLAEKQMTSLRKALAARPQKGGEG